MSQLTEMTDETSESSEFFANCFSSIPVRLRRILRLLPVIPLPRRPSHCATGKNGDKKHVSPLLLWSRTRDELTSYNARTPLMFFSSSSIASVRKGKRVPSRNTGNGITKTARRESAPANSLSCAIVARIVFFFRPPAPRHRYPAHSACPLARKESPRLVNALTSAPVALAFLRPAIKPDVLCQARFVGPHIVEM